MCRQNYTVKRCCFNWIDTIVSHSLKIQAMSYSKIFAQLFMVTLGGWLDAGGSLALDKEPPVNRAYALRKHHEEETRLLVKVELAP